MRDATVIQTQEAPAAIGPYSQGIAAGGFVFTSGQVPLHPQTGEMPAGIRAQAQLALQNLGAVLAAGGSGYERVVKTTCFLADMADFATFNEVYATFFPTNKPARSCVAARELPRGVLCEVEAVALV